MAPLNWVDLAWMAMASASLMLGLIHLLIWTRDRRRIDILVFFVLSAACAAYGVFELRMMRSGSPQEIASAVRWGHVPLAIVVVAIAVFVRLHFGTGRITLLAAIVVLRIATLGLDFTTGDNVNFREVTAVERVFWGSESVAIPRGTPNPWTIVPQLSNLLLLVFVVDASVALWRRGGRDARRRAWLVGGSVVLCVAITAAMATLTVYGLLVLPTVLTPAFLLVALAISYELSGEVIRAARLSQALAASEARLQAVVESVPSAILLADAGGAIRLANAQAEVLFSRPRAALLGRRIETLLPERLREAYARHWIGYAADPSPRPMGTGRELVALRADGSEFPVEVGLAPLRFGGSDQVLVALADISSRRRAEQAAAQQRAELVHLSRVAVLGELSGSLAHEINQPLAAILGNAQAALRFLGREPPALSHVAEALQAIVANDRRASRVIERLRALLRKEEAAHAPVDLNELVDESLRLLRSDLDNRGVRATADLHSALPRVRGDRVQLQQVLLNLILNACEAMEGQPPPRPLVLRTALGAEGGVVVEIADRGPGIAAENVEKMFEPFFTTKAQGLGIGLALCRTIVQAHGGRIGAGPNAGGGARLTVELPAIAGDAR